MTCNTANAKLADMLFEPESVSVEVRSHIEGCARCREELAGLQATMNLMDSWTAPEPSDYFDTKLAARLREEKAAPPAGLIERIRTWVKYGMDWNPRPLAATALTLVLAVGGATYAGFTFQRPTHSQVPESQTVRDLQLLDHNDQILQQLESVDEDADD